MHSETLILNAVSFFSMVSTSKYWEGKIVLHIEKDSDKHLISDCSKSKVLMTVQKLISHRMYVVYTKHGTKEDTRVGCLQCNNGL
jgi:hypothetical protein